MANRWEQVLQLTNGLISNKKVGQATEYKDILENGIYYRKFNTNIRGASLNYYIGKFPIKYMCCYHKEKRSKIAFAVEEGLCVGPVERDYHLITVPKGTIPEEAMPLIVLGSLTGIRYSDDRKMCTHVISPYRRVKEILNRQYTQPTQVKPSPVELDIIQLKQELYRYIPQQRELHILCDETSNVEELDTELKKVGGIWYIKESDSLLIATIPLMRAEENIPREWDLRRKTVVEEPKVVLDEMEEEWYS